ncbi:type IV pilus modification protein PilV [Congregibacter sp.]|uniref:type IV pilus modification protein PilV n=1 Tax=Congregibacter sp. TaxID=2744308 RepID=UPI003F6D10CD
MIRVVGFKQRGVGLIEVLITLLILAVGLLGLAGLQLGTVNGQFDAYQRAQALLLAEEMAGRLRANATVASTAGNLYLAAPGDDLYGARDVEDCTTKVDLAERDLCEWNNALVGSSVQRVADPDNPNLGSIISARGCIESIGAVGDAFVTIRVTVAWQGFASTQAPAIGCASGEYGDETLRRTVSANIILADLSNTL